MHRWPSLSAGKLARYRLLLLSSAQANINKISPNSTPIPQQQISVILLSLSIVMPGCTFDGQFVYCLYSMLAEVLLHVA